MSVPIIKFPTFSTSLRYLNPKEYRKIILQPHNDSWENAEVMQLMVYLQAALGAVGDGVCAVPLHGHRPPQRDVQLDHDVQDHFRLFPALRQVSPGDLSVTMMICEGRSNRETSTDYELFQNLS